jgi:hypothetical protein
MRSREEFNQAIGAALTACMKNAAFHRQTWRRASMPFPNLTGKSGAHIPDDVLAAIFLL